MTNKVPDSPIGKPLSPREMTIAKMISIGMGNSDIASQLGISVKTVDTHRANVMTKLQLPNNVMLARHALRSGWVSLESDLFAVDSEDKETGSS